MTAELSITGDSLDFRALAEAAKGQRRPTLAAAARKRVGEARAVVEKILAENRPAYGITTGVGSQKDYAVDPAAAAAYNARLVRAHATRLPGAKLSAEEVRGALVFLANQCARGMSGVSTELVDVIIAAAGRAEMPVIDAVGTVGASDLVPNSQIACWLMEMPEAKAHGLPKPKETLSLINNNAVSLSAGSLALAEAGRLIDAFDLAGAASLEGFRGCLPSISETANRAHMRKGQASVATRLRTILKGSALWQPGSSRFLQDPLSFRFISQTHGAVHEAFETAGSIWNAELNSCHDNPVIDVAAEGAVSVGNMDTTHMTLAIDYLRLALGRMCDMAGDRIHKLQWPAFSGLPAGFAEDGAIGGVQFLNMGHIAASEITTAKIASQPVLLNSAGQVADGVEDTASHALHAVHQLKRLIDAAWTVTTIEIMTAVWALTRRRVAPDTLGTGVRILYEAIASRLPIGHEGKEIFDLGPFVATIRATSLIDKAIEGSSAHV